jgi:hypothetical protein
MSGVPHRQVDARCAQAGERKHRTDSTTGTAVHNRLSDAARGAP